MWYCKSAADHDFRREWPSNCVYLIGFACHGMPVLRIALARHYAISPTTVQKWRKRTTVSDQPMGPSEPHSTVLSIEQEAMIVAFRRHNLLPLDDCLYALQPTFRV